MYFVKQTFLVFGLSRSGKAVAEFLLSENATVFIYDDMEGEQIERSIKDLEEKGAKRVQKDNVSRMYEVCDVLVLSPGIPIDHPLAIAFKKNKRAVVGESEIAFRYMKCPIIAVTGTNGKTTTVSMISKILSEGKKKNFVCGNYGIPMINYVNAERNEFAVTEISSFQLETLNSHLPHISVVLNITEDHLNRHYKMENYVFLKSKLLKNCSEAEYAVLNYDDETVRSFAEKTKARILWFSTKNKINGAYYDGEAIYFYGEKVIETKSMKIEGVHNIQNALASVCVAKIVGVITEDIATALSNFKGVKHRIEEVGEIDGVKYYDDSKGTNIDATVKAVECMDRETVLLLGGKDKGYDYEKLFTKIKNTKIVNCVIYGENRFTILSGAMKSGFKNILLCTDFNLALNMAKSVAKSGQNVLLSPASASFDEFDSYEERGDAFVSFVKSFERNADEERTKSNIVYNDFE